MENSILSWEAEAYRLYLQNIQPQCDKKLIILQAMFITAVREGYR